MKSAFFRSLLLLYRFFAVLVFSLVVGVERSSSLELITKGRINLDFRESNFGLFFFSPPLYFLFCRRLLDLSSPAELIYLGHLWTAAAAASTNFPLHILSSFNSFTTSPPSSPETPSKSPPASPMHPTTSPSRHQSCFDSPPSLP